jgi:hypothetical protein
MPRRLLHKAQVLTKRISLKSNLDFSQINQTSLRGVGERAHKGFRMIIFIGGTSRLQRREGESFYTCPPTPKKLAVGNKLVKIGTSDFGTGTLEI